ncbi:hypothetical protein CHS0354_035289 [Potamilus streckersoni]|uniref:Uncharacterized protein n=1 Tax=Potamilus streckersoni TaxID=2493646 RepID=A0AAE0S2X3_9BIVA|nr:hypothetical protein CHS0354_035289 [Potamilus streckersoni]
MSTGLLIPRRRTKITFPIISPSAHPVKPDSAFNVKSMLRAYEFEQNGDKNRPRKSTKKLLPIKGNTSRKANLRLLMIDMQNGDTAGAEAYAERLIASENPHYASEGYFYRMYIDVDKKDYAKATERYQVWDKTYGEPIHRQKTDC